MFYYWTAVALDHVGMTYGTLMKPTDFACLVLKMLQISPGKDIVKEFIRQEDFKVRAYALRLLSRRLFPSVCARTKFAHASLYRPRKSPQRYVP